MTHVERHAAVLVALGLALLAFGGAGAAGAQSTDSNPVGALQEQFAADSTRPASSADLVTAEAHLAATPVPAGHAVEAAVTLEVRDPWHVNAHRPTYDYLIGTRLDWAAAPDVATEDLRYPEPKTLRLDFADDAIDVYEGQAPIRFAVRSAPSAAPGERRLTGRLRVQACNDKTCLRPATVRVTLPVPVATADATPTPTGAAVFERSASSSSGGTLGVLLRRHGLFLAGGALVLGTVLFLVVYGRVAKGRGDAA